jgi:polysaccharide export outer membrane protein
MSLAACAGPGSDLQPLPAVKSTEYRLGSGDQIRIIAFGEEQLTGEFHVAANGAIAVPLAGDVQVAGLTLAEVQETLAGMLRKNGLYRNPSIVAEVTAYRPVYVLGEVQKPGAYTYAPSMTVVTAVAMAGGFTYRAVQGYASIVRTVDGHAIEGKAERQSYVQPGDVITILERRF